MGTFGTVQPIGINDLPFEGLNIAFLAK